MDTTDSEAVLGQAGRVLRDKAKQKHTESPAEHPKAGYSGSNAATHEKTVNKAPTDSSKLFIVEYLSLIYATVGRKRGRKEIS